MTCVWDVECKHKREGEKCACVGGPDPKGPCHKEYEKHMKKLRKAAV